MKRGIAVLRSGGIGKALATAAAIRATIEFTIVFTLTFAGVIIAFGQAAMIYGGGA